MNTDWAVNSEGQTVLYNGLNYAENAIVAFNNELYRARRNVVRQGGGILTNPVDGTDWQLIARGDSPVAIDSDGDIIFPDSRVGRAEYNFGTGNPLQITFSGTSPNRTAVVAAPVSTSDLVSATANAYREYLHGAELATEAEIGALRQDIDHLDPLNGIPHGENYAYTEDTTVSNGLNRNTNEDFYNRLGLTLAINATDTDIPVGREYYLFDDGDDTSGTHVITLQRNQQASSQLSGGGRAFTFDVIFGRDFLDRFLTRGFGNTYDLDINTAEGALTFGTFYTRDLVDRQSVLERMTDGTYRWVHPESAISTTSTIQNNVATVQAIREYADAGVDFGYFVVSSDFNNGRPEFTLTTGDFLTITDGANAGTYRKISGADIIVAENANGDTALATFATSTTGTTFTFPSGGPGNSPFSAFTLEGTPSLTNSVPKYINDTTLRWSPDNSGGSGNVENQAISPLSVTIGGTAGTYRYEELVTNDSIAASDPAIVASTSYTAAAYEANHDALLYGGNGVALPSGVTAGTDYIICVTVAGSQLPIGVYRATAGLFDYTGLSLIHI